MCTAVVPAGAAASPSQSPGGAGSPPRNNPSAKASDDISLPQDLSWVKGKAEGGGEEPVRLVNWPTPVPS